MSQALNRLQDLLGELFQLDTAGDLDFGIYRIMNHKRDEINGFIENSLAEIVENKLSKGSTARQTELSEGLQEKAEQVRQNFGDDAISPDGDLLSFQNTPLGSEYLELKEKTEGTTDLEGMKAIVFNHLYTFFSRYYEGGDFLSKRRYSRQQKYAIPYNGEEVYLHWANADQYYIKTGEHFTNYQFTVNDVKVNFNLVAADVEKNNNKGKDRYFLPRTDQAEYDKDESLITIPFEHRPLTDKEESRYGAKNGRQKNINEEAVPHILARFNDNPEAARALEREKPKGSNNQPVSYLQHHLRRYTARNNSDFFIHKDLKGFLEGELDFYLKNEVLNIDDLDSDRWGEERAESWFEVMQAMKRIGREIIAFLAQIEDYQKKLFEKKKFVTAAEYCLTLDRVPEELYSEILDNEDQIAEWEDLFKISEIEGTVLNGGGGPSVQWLKDNPYLLLDTKFFDQDFKDRLLSSFEELDEQTAGLLINSENFQALNLLQERYREQVKFTYIDPPYNTGSSAILYKNNYKHSSWLTLMYDRLAELKPTLTEDGAIFVSIDKTERTMLEHAMDKVFGPDNRVEELIWSMNTNNGQAPNYSTNHEYVEVYAKNRDVAERDSEMFREPKPGFQEIMALVESLNPSYPPISTIETELQNLYEQHKIEYQAEGGKEQGDDPWRGLFNYSHAEYRDSNGNPVSESEAEEKEARIWIWRESDSSMPATKQAASTYDSFSPNWRFYKPPHPVTGEPVPHPKSGWKFAYDNSQGSPGRRSFVSLDRDGRIA